MEAGRNAGVALNIAVLSGAHSRDKLAQSPQTHKLKIVADITGLLSV
jgi:phosphoglycolate phosphatase-like HAD superfamily hydrolase